MKRFNWFRGVALALAGIMVLNYVAIEKESMVAEAAGENIQIQYVLDASNPGIGARTAEIIRGQEVSVLISNIANCQPRTEGALSVLKAVPKSDGTDGVDIVPAPNDLETGNREPQAGNKDKYTIKTLTDYAANYAGNGPPDESYTIRTNYDALETTAVTKILDSGSRPTGNVGKLEALNGKDVAVNNTSYAVITYNGNNFEMSPHPNPATYPYGLFANWTQSASISSENDPTLNIENCKSVILTFGVVQSGASTGGVNTNFKFTHGARYSVEVTDPVTGETKTEWRDGIRIGDKFLIEFSGPTSPEIMLTVVNPLKVLQDVAKAAVNVMNTAELSEFVKLQGEADKPFTYISDNMDLRTSYTGTKSYGEEVNLQWRLVDGAGNDVEVTIDGVTYKLMEALKNKPGSSGGWSSTDIRFPREDVPNIYLQVEASYAKGTSFYPQNKTATAQVSNVKIIGTGVSPEITTIKGQDIDGIKDIFTFDETDPIVSAKKFPKSITMDVYKGGVDGYDDLRKGIPAGPYKLTLNINSGSGNGLLQGFQVNSSNPSALTAEYKQGNDSPAEYQWGTRISTADNLGSTIEFTIYPQTGDTTTTLEFQFWREGPDNTEILDKNGYVPRELEVKVQDTSPNKKASLNADNGLELTDGNNKAIEGFTFDPGTYIYDLPDLAYSTDKVFLRAYSQNRENPSNKTMGINVEVMNDSGIYVEAGKDIWKGKDSWPKEWIPPNIENPTDADKTYSLQSGKKIQLNLPTPGQTVRVTITVRAQHPEFVQSYVIYLMRGYPAKTSTLESLKLVDESDKDYMAEAPNKPFAQQTFEYDVEIPFKVTKVRPEYEPTDPNASVTVGNASSLAGIISAMTGKWVDAKPSQDPKKIEVTVKSEYYLAYEKLNGEDRPDDFEQTKSVYTLNITHADPSTDATLKVLDVTDTADPPVKQTMKPGFTAGQAPPSDGYVIELPYTMSKVKLTAEPNNDGATLELLHKRRKVGKLLPNVAKELSISEMKSDSDFDDWAVKVTAEDGETTNTYPIKFMRAAASKDASLQDVKILNEAGADATVPGSYEFDKTGEKTQYTVKVPYDTEKITLTPTANQEGATIKVDGKTVASGSASSAYTLEYPGTITVKIVVTPENKSAAKKTYTFKISREAPSNDAWLANLTLTGVDLPILTPRFVPKTLEYDAVVTTPPEGADATVTVTATLSDPKYATMTINGLPAQSGVATEPITVYEAEQDIEIIVTAQDGKTQKKYIVHLKDKSKLPVNSNADLKSLTVDTGEFTPKFQASVTTYDVAVVEDVKSVQLFPTPADPEATYKVFLGTKEIGDAKGNYAEYIVDGENAFKITVTASDGKTTKDYNVRVYRNEEDMMGSLTPIDAEEIDFENSGEVITVDISKYTRVNANVFEEMKEYPEKRIVFQGNDYSLEFKGSDLQNVVIPNTEIFDFGMSYTSPNEQDIYDVIDRYPENDGARIALVHFKYHGMLPAPAKLTLTLGYQYRDSTLYWHYFNEERDRLDYYGPVTSNSQGNIAVTLDHMSTYVVADMRLFGSENLAKATETEPLNQQVAADKVNPNTGVREGSR